MESASQTFYRVDWRAQMKFAASVAGRFEITAEDVDIMRVPNWGEWSPILTSATLSQRGADGYSIALRGLGIMNAGCLRIDFANSTRVMTY